MRMAGYLRVLGIVCGVCAWLAGQGLTTKASRDDWEEINFAFNSSVLSDGYPSLLRLADLLVRNPGYTTKLYGYTDSTGPDSVNNPLSTARATAVAAFLVKHGARQAQIQAIGGGPLEPVASNGTMEGRFMNRRVRIMVTDEKGRSVSASPLSIGLRPIREIRPTETPALRKVQQTTRSVEAGYPACFTVQLGTFREQANAERLEELVSRGSLRAEIRPWGANPPWWRVTVGCEATRHAAEELAAHLAGYSDGAVIVRLYNPTGR